MEYRNLTDREIETLKSQGCSSDNWGAVKVRDKLNSDVIFEVHFSGEIHIGDFIMEGSMPSRKTPGLYHSTISNCTIGDNVRIADVGIIHGYTIGNGSVIERTSEISVEGESGFGNGQALDVLNEGGGRELIIYDELTSQVAYLNVLYQHDSDLQKSLSQLISSYVGEKKSGTGTIGNKVSIRNTSIIRNVNIGDSASVDGAVSLTDGTIASCEEDPVKIGEGVTARHFIIHHGTAVESNAMLDKVFAGQGVRLGKQLSAENTVYFANCEGFHGEAVSLFAGPYSVSHHKSTLLIAALTSFYNAGSGTNQSNHMYKLGPIHQGILERGSKTGSFAYLLWPCRVGAYSVVMGKHGGNFDASEFPFSYITVEDEKSFLTPGMNLITVGTRRDVEKWPSRDRRKTSDKLDLITFEWLNPLIVQKSMNASTVLTDLYEKTPKEQEAVNYKGLRIKRLLLKTCRRYYDMLVPVFIGEQVIGRIENNKPLKQGAKKVGLDANWLDIGGMVTVKEELDSVIGQVRSGNINSVVMLRKQLAELNDSYKELSWGWTVSLIQQIVGKEIDKLEKEDLIKIVNAWKENKIKLNNMILADAKKEFDQSSKIGFGVDGDSQVRDLDFETVRGTYDGNKFVKGVLAENKAIESKADEIIKRLH